MKLKDLTGQRFTRLIVVNRIGSSHREALWLCLCDCGANSKVTGYRLRAGGTKSCGCLVRNVNKGNQHNFRHGKSHTKAYRAWSAMKSRCRDIRVKAYPLYGGRGIEVCERWRKFENFLADMGDPPSDQHSIDRYPDNNGDYELGNCRWATRKEQANNQRTNRLLTHNGQTKTLQQWADLIGVTNGALRRRLYYLDWPVERALIPLNEMYPQR